MFNKVVASLLLFFTISSFAFAEDTVVLKKGEAAPYDGFLIDRAKADKYYLLSETLESCTKISDLRIKESDIQEKRITNLNTELNNMSERLVSQQESSFWGKVGFFFVGAAAASLVAYGAAKSVR